MCEEKRAIANLPASELGCPAWFAADASGDPHSLEAVTAGVELARELGKLRPGISTLFMSGYTDHRLLELLPEMRRPAVLQKPLNLQTLLETIDGAMKQTSGALPIPPL